MDAAVNMVPTTTSTAPVLPVPVSLVKVGAGGAKDIPILNYDDASGMKDEAQEEG